MFWKYWFDYPSLQRGVPDFNCSGEMRVANDGVREGEDRRGTGAARPTPTALGSLGHRVRVPVSQTSTRGHAAPSLPFDEACCHRRVQCFVCAWREQGPWERMGTLALSPRPVTGCCVAWGRSLFSPERALSPPGKSPAWFQKGLAAALTAGDGALPASSAFVRPHARTAVLGASRQPRLWPRFPCAVHP